MMRNVKDHFLNSYLVSIHRRPVTVSMQLNFNKVSVPTITAFANYNQVSSLEKSHEYTVFLPRSKLYVGIMGRFNERAFAPKLPSLIMQHIAQMNQCQLTLVHFCVIEKSPCVVLSYSFHNFYSRHSQGELNFSSGINFGKFPFPLTDSLDLMFNNNNFKGSVPLIVFANV